MSNVLEAIKTIYPDINGGYAYFETQPNGNDWVNPIDGLVWENTEYPKPSWAEIEAVLPSLELNKAKNEKIAQIKVLRKEINQATLPLTAYELINGAVSNNLVTFKFKLFPTGDALTEPSTVMLKLATDGVKRSAKFLDNLATLIADKETDSQLNDQVTFADLKQLLIGNGSNLYQLPAIGSFYSCAIINDDGSIRQGYVYIDQATFFSIQDHINVRVVTNIQAVNALEVNILNATSVAEVETLFAEYSQLNPNSSRFVNPS